MVDSEEISTKEHFKLLTKILKKNRVSIGNSYFEKMINQKKADNDIFYSNIIELNLKNSNHTLSLSYLIQAYLKGIIMDQMIYKMAVEKFLEEDESYLQVLYMIYKEKFSINQMMFELC